MKRNEPLSTERLMPEKAEPRHLADRPINADRKDYRKIIYSVIFPRLQDQTYAFPEGVSRLTRTRMTHSIKASAMEKHHKDELAGKKAQARPSIFQCAGLMCALRGSPFGLFEENSIGDWFRDNLKNIEYRGQPVADFLPQKMYEALSRFEGNAQASRIFLKSRHDYGVDVSEAMGRALAMDRDDLEPSAGPLTAALLEGLVRAVLYYGCEAEDGGYELSTADEKYIALLSRNGRDEYDKAKTGNEHTDLYLRLLMAADCVSEMTNTDALARCRK